MICIHCLEDLKKKTRDHVFPSSWYTDDTPSWVERWTVPSCRACNEKFGKLEQELFIRLVPCIDPKKAEASGITNKLIKTFQKRPHFLRELSKNLKPYSKNMKILPGLGLHKGFSIESQKGIDVPRNLLISVLEKIFKGVEYKLTGQHIKDPYNLEIYHVYEEPELVKNLFQKNKKVNFLGPGFKLERISPDGRTRPVLYKTTIWGTLVSYAWIDKKQDT